MGTPRTPVNVTAVTAPAVTAWEVEAVSVQEWVAAVEEGWVVVTEAWLAATITRTVPRRPPVAAQSLPLAMRA